MTPEVFLQRCNRDDTDCGARFLVCQSQTAEVGYTADIMGLVVSLLYIRYLKEGKTSIAWAGIGYLRKTSKWYW